MATTKKKPATAKRTAKATPELVYEEGYWWIVKGNVRVNAGRSERYARNLMAEGGK